MKALLIPIKDFANAKTRLADLLSPEERKRLAWAMLEDVSRAIKACSKPDSIVMVTSFEPAIGHARRHGWDVLVEESQSSESASIDRASRALQEGGFDTVMRLPADLPLIQAEDIDALLSIELRAPAALLVPSREGTGTNAIIRTPPNIFPSRFGPNSLALHREEAARAGAQFTAVNNSRIALDIDEPPDLKLFVEVGRGTETFDLLAEIRIAERLRD